MADALEVMARRIFEEAIRTDRCGELLQCLFDGGSATIDPSAGLVLAPASIIQQLGRADG